MWRWITLGVAATSTLMLVLAFMMLEPVATAGEDGTFANDCCGTVELSGGKMLLNDKQSIRYSVAKDERGSYILARTYVGVVPDWGFDVDGTRSMAKLRLDRLPAPTRLVLYEGLRPYVFTRQPPRRGAQ